MQIRFVETDKGARLALFQDCYHQECSFQGDTVQGVPVLWLGCNRDFQGKQAMRMVLDKHRAQVLREILTQFIDTDKVAKEPNELPATIRAREPDPKPES